MTDQIQYKIEEDANCHSNVNKINNKLVFNYPCSLTHNCKPYHVQFPKGKYLFELWGAQGGDSRGSTINAEAVTKDSGGKGAYVSGILNLHSFSKFYFYIGGKGQDQSSTSANVTSYGGYNGGGNGGIDTPDPDHPESGAGGGGSTDIRLLNQDLYGDKESFKSRIIVAGAGGGAVSVFAGICNSGTINGDMLCSDTNRSTTGGHGGVLFGYRTNCVTKGGTQTTGSFGKGDNGMSLNLYKLGDTIYYGGSTGGGGGGYYGGVNLKIKTYVSYIESGGAGGSSYVSGCVGCQSVSQFPTNEVTHNNNNEHYSHLKLCRLR